MPVPNTGDILTLSQIAWKTGRAFAAGRTGAPAEFAEVEAEISSLAKTLKGLAETLHANDRDALQNLERDVQMGINTILHSCQRTVHDLDSLVDQYQVIKKHRTVGGFAIERTWSDLVLAEYKTTIWTTEGGDIEDLKSMLRMHASSISLLSQALQSDSPSRLENIVSPMAKRIESVYHVSGNIDAQLEELHHYVQNLVTNDPTEQPPSIPERNPARSPAYEIGNPMQNLRMPYPPRGSSLQRPSSRSSLPRRPTSSEACPLRDPTDNTPSSPKHKSLPLTTSPPRNRVSEFSFGGSSARYSSSSCASSDAGWSNAGPSRDSVISRQALIPTKNWPLPDTPELREPGQEPEINAVPLLPPPALSSPPAQEISKIGSTLSPFPTTQSGITKLHRSSTTASQKSAFEKEAFRNSAVLCDVRGKSVEYSRQMSEDDVRDVEMVEASEECRIAVVRKRVHDPETKKVRVVTSIWTFSDNNNVRIELRMEDGEMYIPYSSYFSPCKVSMTAPCVLKFHDVRYGNRLVKAAKSSWVNYVFETPQDAALFQNEIMGRTLLATFRTAKTMRLHSGFSGAFAYAEQMCALENLRVWEDADTGAIIAMIHFSASFRDGYLAFYLNSTTNPIRVKDEGAREVRIKGLKVPLDNGARALRKDSAAGEGGAGAELDKKKIISGARIEFATEMEKREFMDMVAEMQREMIELPDLLGVN